MTGLESVGLPLTDAPIDLCSVRMFTTLGLLQGIKRSAFPSNPRFHQVIKPNVTAFYWKNPLLRIRISTSYMVHDATVLSSYHLNKKIGCPTKN